MLRPGLILGILNWSLIFLATFVYLLIFLMVYRCRRELKDISLLLTCNTCLAGLLTCLTVSVMISSNLFAGFLLVDMKFCFAWGLFYDIFECSIYHSYCLQAFYRLCRVVFYTKRFLLSYNLYLILIVVQWSWILALLIPPVFVGWYARLPTENYCLVPYTYIVAEVYHIMVLYLVPLICIGVTYLWITNFMRQTNRASTLVIAAVQRQRNQRDLTVIKRIIMLVSILVTLRFPTIIFLIHAVITGGLYPLTYGVVGVITSACLIFIGIITIYITTQLRKQFNGFFFSRPTNQVRTAPLPPVQCTTTMNMLVNLYPHSIQMVQ
jgi:hypothetical protein